MGQSHAIERCHSGPGSSLRRGICPSREASGFPPGRARAPRTQGARRLASLRIRTSRRKCAMAAWGHRAGKARRRRRSPSEQPTRARRGRVRHQGPAARPAREDARSVGRRRRLAGAWVPSQRSCGPHVAGLDDDVDRHGRRVSGDGSGRTNLRRSVKPADGPTNPSRTPSFRRRTLLPRGSIGRPDSTGLSRRHGLPTGAVGRACNRAGRPGFAPLPLPPSPPPRAGGDGDADSRSGRWRGRCGRGRVGRAFGLNDPCRKLRRSTNTLCRIT